jgi:hypothetical protein
MPGATHPATLYAAALMLPRRPRSSLADSLCGPGRLVTGSLMVLATTPPARRAATASVGMPTACPIGQSTEGLHGHWRAGWCRRSSVATSVSPSRSATAITDASVVPSGRLAYLTTRSAIRV